MSTTYMAKTGELGKDWYIIDAAGKPLGRVAVIAATILKGKHRPEYTPHIESGDHVIVLNADKIILTGKKLENKFYYRHTGYVGGLKAVAYKDLMAKNPEKALMLAVKGMLPNNTLGRKALTKLRVYQGENHGHEAQMPQVWNG